jgi:hypothetical protein
VSTSVTQVRRLSGIEEPMTTPNEDDQFERIRLVARIERARALITQYEESQEFFRRQIEDSRYELGRLDERLGG